MTNTIRRIFMHNTANIIVRIDIQTLSVIEGDFPARALGLVIEWAILHKSELLQNWYNIEQKQSLQKIEPLK